MKKMWKKLMTSALTAAMVLGGIGLAPASVARAEEFTGEALVYIGFGGDAEAEGDWAYQYNSPENEGNTAGITAETASIKVGDTVTVSLEFDNPVVNTWWMAPVMVAEGLGDVDATVTCKIDGNDVAINADGADLWWYEGTGDYTSEQSIRLYGGFNEWGTQYIEEPAGFTKVEYTITLNAASTAEAAAKDFIEYDGEATLYVGFGGDKDAEGDWAYQYNSPENEGNTEGITAVVETIKSGETKTVSLEFDSPVVNTWWMAPVLVAEGIGEMDATVTCKIDGNEVEINSEDVDLWWYEGTGDYSETQSIRLYGGFNEWGTQYIAEPSGFTKVEYTVTLNGAKVGVAAEEEAPAVSAAGDVDLNGTYHAYIGFQSPIYSFRNQWDDASYGASVEDGKYFNQITGWDGSDPITVPGTFSDAEIKGNGSYSVSANNIEWLDGEFDSQDYMNLIFISTDIPNTGAITIDDVVLKINGGTVDLASCGAIVSPDSVDYLVILLQNIWNEDVKTIGYYNTPFTDIQIDFSVSGFAYDAEVAAPEEAPAETVAEPAPAEAPVEAVVSAPVQESKSNTGLIVGIVAAVVVVAGAVCGVVVSKKKKK
ncbi:MAG: hypothetical protein K6E92_05690 [Lachnospiraceae bacterium]|nr:hypothetical protein [Lachnospiraceae bacterium]